MKFSSSRLLLKASVVLAVAAAPLAAHADRIWLLPASTVLSDRESWVTVDGAVSDDLFHAGHAPLRLDGLLITAPDGSPVQAQNAITGRYRSVFDVELTQTGTYRLTVDNHMIAASYKVGDQKKRWRGSVDAFAKEVPADAQDLDVTENDLRIEAFVTRGKPSTGALKPVGHGLELVAISHPTDLVAGSTGSFQLLLDGQPASNVKVSVVPGGSRYRDSLDDTTIVTDSNGKFDARFPNPGTYWMGADVRDAHTSFKQAKSRRAVYAATLEVQPQ